MHIVMRKAVSAAIFGLVAAVACPAYASVPEVNEPWVGSQTGGGETQLTMVVEPIGERGGIWQYKVIEAPEGTDPADLVDEDGNPDENGEYILNPYYNPDENWDGLGDNIAFVVPVAITYAARANGVLIGPTNAAIENRSVFPIHVSSVDVDEVEPFSIVDDASSVIGYNIVDFSIGPVHDMIEGAGYLEKTPVNTPFEWNMGAYGFEGDLTFDPSSPASYKLPLVTGGHCSYLTADVIKQRQKFGEVHWYVTPGRVEATHTALAEMPLDLFNEAAQREESHEGFFDDLVRFGMYVPGDAPKMLTAMFEDGVCSLADVEMHIADISRGEDAVIVEVDADFAEACGGETAAMSRLFFV